MNFVSSNSVRAGLHPGGKYIQVKLVRLVGMMLIVYIRQELRDQLRDVVGEQIGTGLLGRMVYKHNILHSCLMK